jgi:uncharacterized protein YacL
MSQRPTSVTAVAVINIILGVLCGCSSLSMMVTPAMMSMYQKVMSPMMKQITQQFEADKRREIARLRSERKEATTQEEREQIDAEIETWKSLKMPDMSKFYSAFTTPKVTTFYVAAGIVGCLINLLFLISGIGLFYVAEWARKMSITASVVCIVATLVSTVFNFIIVIPATAQSLQDMMTEMQKMMPPGQSPPPLMDMGGMMQVWTAIWSGFYCLLLCGWLVAAIVMLSQSRVREAFHTAEVRQ